MTLAGVLLLALLGYKGARPAKAWPTRPETSSRPCTTFTLESPITAHQHLYDVIPVNNNIDAVSYSVDLDTWDNLPFPDRITDNITISRTYSIHAQLSVPPHGVKKSFLQVASHGGGFDSRYWDIAVQPEKYSYVDAALAAGYSIMTYDRISTGQSSKPPAYTDVQIPAEVEVLRVISERALNGTLPSNTTTSFPSFQIPPFTNLLHIGHSLGSLVTYGLISQYPTLSSAAVLTGFLIDTQVFSLRQTAMDLQYAPENDPRLFSDSSSGYLVEATESALQASFFSSRTNTTTGIGGFEPEVLDYAYSIRQPAPLVEMGSGIVLYLDHPTAPQFTGPVQLMVGEFDFLVCRGDCRGTYNETMLGGMFPEAKDLEVYLQPGTGHGLPLHNNATLGFKASFDFLEKNGL